MNCLVTGGAGFIGYNLIKKLVEEGHRVEVIDALKTGKKEGVKRKIKDITEKIEGRFIKGSVEEIDAYNMQDSYDVIFHLAAESRIQPSFDNPVKTHESNVTGTIKVLELAKKTNARLIFAGSSSVYDDFYSNPYAFSKKIGEDYCILYNKIYDVPVSIARFFNVYGPDQLEEGPYATVVGIFENQYKNKKPLTITGDGEQRRDFVHVEDIVSGLIAMSKKDYKADIFNLGTGSNHSINEIAKMFNHEFIYIPKRQGEAQNTLADISFSCNALGYKPTIKIEDYIKSVVQKYDKSSLSNIQNPL